ncbi:hypothetical protein Patl1_17207 [Pistacia atlantica]|uniref:Uncharacterized protein n=1 Tax=Pistacia atlantica TaxID=434234 RepID=A0ACC1B7G4_9ROSI|nr:hypothetical protein Patl1_17207 [Pistacia atlantica]
MTWPPSNLLVTNPRLAAQSIFTDSARCVDPLDTRVLSSSQPETHLDSSSSPPSSPSLAPVTHDSAPLAPQDLAPSLSIPHSHIITRSQTGHSKPRSFPDFHLYYSTRHPLQALHAGMVISEPCTYAQAAPIPEWHAAMESEFQALLKNETWSLLSRPKSNHPPRAASMVVCLCSTPMAAFQICLQVWFTSSLLADGLDVAGQAILACSFLRRTISGQQLQQTDYCR